MQPPKNLVDLPGHKTPVWVIHGWGGGAQGYGPLLQALNAHGHRVLFAPLLRRGGSSLLAAHAPYPVLGLQAEYQLEIIEALGLSNLVLLGHSMGGAIAKLAGNELHGQHAQVRVICLCSACVQPDNPAWLTARMVWKGWYARRNAKGLVGEELQIVQAAGREGLAYVTANRRRAFLEGWALAVHSRRILTATAPGLDVYYVAGLRDKLFSARQHRKAIAHRVAPNRYLELNITHDPQYSPTEAAYLVAELTSRELLTL